MGYEEAKSRDPKCGIYLHRLLPSAPQYRWQAGGWQAWDGQESWQVLRGAGPWGPWNADWVEEEHRMGYVRRLPEEVTQWLPTEVWRMLPREFWQAILAKDPFQWIHRGFWLEEYCTAVGAAIESGKPVPMDVRRAWRKLVAIRNATKKEDEYHG